MNREERFHRSVNVLAKAYREGTLQSNSCCGCAVGNLIADAMDCDVVRNRAYGALQWEAKDGSVIPMGGEWVFPLSVFRSPENANSLAYKDGVAQLNSLGYTLQEVSSIENAFERAAHESRITNTPGADHSYAGLASVYNALCKIHDVPVVDQVEPNTLFFKEEKPEYTEMMVEIHQR